MPPRILAGLRKCWKASGLLVAFGAAALVTRGQILWLTPRPKLG